MNIVNFRNIAKITYWLLVLAVMAPLSFATQEQNPTPQQLIDQFETLFQDGRPTYGRIQERMKLHRVPGLSIAVIQNGKLAWTKGYGLLSANNHQPVTPDTVFSVGSVSKFVAAVLALRLVALNTMALDKNINTYLKDWKVAESSFTSQQPVTLRHILSHTAGFTVHGFQDFQPGERLPSTLEIVTGTHPAKNPPVIVNFVPGSKFRYSGGGTTVAQFAIEQVTEQSFSSAARQFVFKPLGMDRSTYQNPLPPSHGNIANAHNREGIPVALPRGWESMPEQAASGLWTSSLDLAKLMIMLIETHRGKRNDFLPIRLITDMMSPVHPSDFGLGPRLSPNGVFGHGGSNNSYKAQIRGNLNTGSGIVVLTNSASGRTIIEEVLNVYENLEQNP